MPSPSFDPGSSPFPAQSSVPSPFPVSPDTVRPGPEALIGRLSFAFAAALALVLGLDLVWDIALPGREGSRAAAILFDLFTDVLALLAGLATGLRGWLIWRSECCELSGSGIVLVRRRTRIGIPWTDLAVLPSPEGPLAQALGIRNLRIRSGGRVHVLQGYPEAFIARVIATSRAAALPVPSDFPDPAALIALREDESLEFKSTLRWNLRENKVDRAMEHAVLKTIAAFLNASGGMLAIGVDDAGVPLGLGRDFATLPKKNPDGFENHLRQLVAQQIGQRFLVFVKIRFAQIESRGPGSSGSRGVSSDATNPDRAAADQAGGGKEALPGDHLVCYLRVLPSPEPAFLRSGEGEGFYLRTGNATSSLGLAEACAYSTSGRFPR